MARTHVFGREEEDEDGKSRTEGNCTDEKEADDMIVVKSCSTQKKNENVNVDDAEE